MCVLALFGWFLRLVRQAILFRAGNVRQARRLLHDVDDEGLTPLALAASYVQPRRCLTVPRQLSMDTTSTVGTTAMAVSVTPAVAPTLLLQSMRVSLAESFLPMWELDTAATMVNSLLRFDRQHNDSQIDLVLALPVAAAAGASPSTMQALIAAKAEVRACVPRARARACVCACVCGWVPFVRTTPLARGLCLCSGQCENNQSTTER